MAARLESLIKLLETCKQDAPIEFDFCGFQPTEAHSFRGLPSNVAIGYSHLESSVYVSDFLISLNSALKNPFAGFLGGVFRIPPDSLVFVSNYSEKHFTIISGVVDLGYGVILNTTHHVY